MEPYSLTIAAGITLTALLALLLAEKVRALTQLLWGIALGAGGWVLVGSVSALLEAVSILASGMRPMLTALPFVGAIRALAIIVGVVAVFSILMRQAWVRAGHPAFTLSLFVSLCAGACVPWLVSVAQFRREVVPCTLIVRDSAERPLTGARVSWAIMEEAGWRSHAGYLWKKRLDAPPAATAASGRATVWARPGRYRTEVRIEKTGFAPALLTFRRNGEGKWAAVNVTFPGYANGRGGDPSHAGPLVVYLPTEEEFSAKQHVRVRAAAWRIVAGEPNARIVRLWTTRSGVPVEVRIWPELRPHSEAWPHPIVWTRVEPLHGAKLALHPASPIHFDASANSPEWLNLAPTDGTTNTLELQAGSLPPDSFYVLAAQGEEFGRLFIEYCGAELIDGKRSQNFVVEAVITHNPTGSRALYPPRTEYRKPAIE